MKHRTSALLTMALSICAVFVGECEPIPSRYPPENVPRMENRSPRPRRPRFPDAAITGAHSPPSESLPPSCGVVLPDHEFGRCKRLTVTPK